MKIVTRTLPTGAVLTGYIHDDSREFPPEVSRTRPALVLCPGGGYFMTSDREADPPAMAFLNMGFQVFTLRYSVQEAAGNKRPLEELARSVQLVRQNCGEWGVDPKKLVVMGFSAGGHLAASLGTHWNDPELLERCGASDAGLRPDAMVLCYPVICANEYAHQGSIDLVSRDCPEPRAYWGLENWVNAQTPPAFLWHTMEDDCVPVENSVAFAMALRRAGVACECHLFMQGHHGLSVCTPEVGTPGYDCGRWLELCRAWLAALLGPLPGC